MKKILALTSSIILAFTMAGCGSTASDETSSGTLSSTAETATESSEAVQESAPASEESSQEENESIEAENEESSSDENTEDKENKGDVVDPDTPVKIRNVRIIPGGIEKHGDVTNESLARAGEIVYAEICDAANNDLSSYIKHLNFQGFFGTGLLDAYSKTQEEEKNDINSIIYRYQPLEFMINTYEDYITNFSEEDPDELMEELGIDENTEMTDEIYSDLINAMIQKTTDEYIESIFEDCDGHLRFSTLTAGLEKPFTPSDEDTVFIIPCECERYNDVDYISAAVYVQGPEGRVGCQAHIWVSSDDQGAFIDISLRSMDTIEDEDDFIEKTQNSFSEQQTEEHTGDQWKDQGIREISEVFSYLIVNNLEKEGITAGYDEPDGNAINAIKTQFKEAISPEGISADSTGEGWGDRYIIDLMKKHGLKGRIYIGFITDIDNVALWTSGYEFYQYLDEDGMIHQFYGDPNIPSLSSAGVYDSSEDGIEFGKLIEKDLTDDAKEFIQKHK